MLTFLMENHLSHTDPLSHDADLGMEEEKRIVIGNHAVLNIRGLFEHFASSHGLALHYFGSNNAFPAVADKTELLQLLFDWLNHSVANITGEPGLAVEVETGGTDRRALLRCHVECWGAGIAPVRLSKLFHRFCGDERRRISRARLNTGHLFSRTTFHLDGGTIEVDSSVDTTGGKPVTSLCCWFGTRRAGIKDRRSHAPDRQLNSDSDILVEYGNTYGSDEKPVAEDKSVDEMREVTETRSLQKNIVGRLIDSDERRLRYDRIVNADLPAGTGKDADEQFLEKLMAVLEAHVADPDFNVSKLVTAIGMSRPVLFRKAKVLTGSSIINLIRTRRLKLAEALLKQKNVAVSEVAFQVGYTDPKYFSKSFRSEYGKTPREYAHGL